MTSEMSALFGIGLDLMFLIKGCTTELDFCRWKLADSDVHSITARRCHDDK
jgi:hypothetical protein